MLLDVITCFFLFRYSPVMVIGQWRGRCFNSMWISFSHYCTCLKLLTVIVEAFCPIYLGLTFQVLFSSYPIQHHILSHLFCPIFLGLFLLNALIQVLFGLSWMVGVFSIGGRFYENHSTWHTMMNLE